MSYTILFKRAAIPGGALHEGEPGWDTDDHRLYVGDGTTNHLIGPGGADASYTHDQASPSATWTVTHNLGKFPSVTVVDSGGNVVQGDVEHVSANQLILTFSSAFGGKAHLN